MGVVKVGQNFFFKTFKKKSKAMVVRKNETEKFRKIFSLKKKFLTSFQSPHFN